MPTIKPWLLGRHVTITLTPQDVSSAGVWSDNAYGALTFTGYLEEAGSSVNVNSEDINTMDSDYDNPVIISLRTTYTLSEILAAQALGTGKKLLRALTLSFYAKLVIVQKDHAGAAQVTETAYVQFEGYDPNYRRGKCAGQARFVTRALANATPGVYDANPAFTWA